MSDIETALWRPFKDEGIIVIGISSERVSAIKQFVTDHGLTFPILHDTKSVYNTYFLNGGISPYPRDFIIDRDGIIKYTNTEYDVNTMKLIVEGLIKSTSVKEDRNTNAVPRNFELHQNYPNPFNPYTRILYSLPVKSDVRLEIYNLLGKKIKTLVSAQMPRGIHQANWNGTDETGKRVSSGLYIYRLRAGSFVSARKMFLLK